MAKAEAPTQKMTFEEFLAWCNEDTWAEWVDGEVIMLSPASSKHQDIRGLLELVLRAYSESRDLGKVLAAPFLMRLPEALKRGREPDILFVAKKHLSRLKPTYLAGPADLVVEITSPESILRDRGEKFAEYELGGVREYWLIDPEAKRADFYGLDSEGRYARRRPDAQGIYHSEVVEGFGLKVDWLWPEPLPPLIQIQRELGLI
jgi:Uma2 family endonuclease